MKALYTINHLLCHDKKIVESYFGILENMLRELLQKTNLYIIFLLDVVVCC
jgi:hypothetical protein